MTDRFDRLRRLLGAEALERLHASSVLVCGLGGVGSPCAEALVRCGVGRIGLLDGETVATPDCNRQLIALDTTVGRPKTEVFAERARAIHPEVVLETYSFVFNRETADRLDVSDYDAVAECIDTLVPKLNIHTSCLDRGVPFVASSGAGFRTDPTRVRVGSLWDTRSDPLAHRMRKKLRKWGYGDREVRVVYSEEPVERTGPRPDTIGSIVTVTGVFGLTLASAILSILLEKPSG